MNILKEFRKKVESNDPTGASLLIFELEEEVAKMLYAKDIKSLHTVWVDLTVLMKRLRDSNVFENEFHRIWGLSYLIRKFMEAGNEEIQGR